VRQPSAVHLLDTGIIWEKLVYCLANAVSSWLVASHHAWPGFHTLPDALTNGPKVYARPTEYFSTRTQLPDTATLVITKPPALAHLSDDDYVAQLKKRVAAKESGLNKRSRDGKRPFLGVTAIMAQDPHGHPQTPRPQNEVNPESPPPTPKSAKPP
jgi:hypothetical protein